MAWYNFVGLVSGMMIVVAYLALWLGYETQNRIANGVATILLYLSALGLWVFLVARFLVWCY